MADDRNDLGFVDPKTVEELKKNPPVLTPAQKAISDVASAAIREVESIFDGETFTRNGRTYTRSKISDEDIDFVLRLVDQTKLSREQLREKILATKPGEYFMADGRAFFMTADFKVQEASAYVNRLEKAVAASFKAKTDAETKWQSKCIAAELAQRKAESSAIHLRREVERLRQGGLIVRFFRRIFRRSRTEPVPPVAA